MWVINPSGRLVEVNHRAIEVLEAAGIWQLFGKAPNYYVGSGPEKRIALQTGSLGLGDDIHAVPGVVQKLRDGYDVTFIGQPFRRPLWERIGCTFFPERDLPEDWPAKWDKDYGKFYILRGWSTQHLEETKGQPTETQFEQLARLIDTTVPKHVDWHGILKPRHTGAPPHIMFVPYSLSRNRTIEDPVRLPLEWGLAKIAPLRVLGHPDQLLPTFQALVDAVYSAGVVVATESGVLALALALQKPCVAIMGPTDAKIIIDEFRQYSAAWNVRAIYPAKNTFGCRMPCNWMPMNGYGVGGRCDHGASLCMAAVDEAAVVAAAAELFNMVR